MPVAGVLKAAFNMTRSRSRTIPYANHKLRCFVPAYALFSCKYRNRLRSNSFCLFAK